MANFENPKDYQFLLQFTNGDTASRSNLEHRYGADFVDRHIANGWIVQIDITDDNDSIFGISNAGKAYRDN